MQMSKIDQFLFAKNITEWMDVQPLFLHGHFSFVDFQRFFKLIFIKYWG